MKPVDKPDLQTSKPAVSVITIVKNNEELLPRAIDSVIKQNFTDLEYIIVNDGSTDGTGGVIDAYAEKDSRIRPQHMPQNIGRAMARNTGLDNATGDYIFFLDADDYLPPTALDDLYTVARKDNADKVFGRIRAFDPSTGSWLHTHYTDQLITPEKHGFKLDDQLTFVWDHSIFGRLYRHDFLRANNIRFSTERRNAEDVLFAFYTTFYADKLSTIPQKTVYFYSIGNYLATANESKIFDARDNILETINFSRENGSEALKASMLRKGLSFVSNLIRVQKVYDMKVIEYIQSLTPFIKNVPNEMLNELPLYPKQFAMALAANDFEGAFQAWNQEKERGKMSRKKSSDGSKAGDQALYEMEEKNHALAIQLDELYSSLSWRVTRPLRFFHKLFSRFKKVQ